MGALLKLIHDDFKCWENTHIAPESYYKAHWMYLDAESADFTTMAVCMQERSQMKEGGIKDYHEWISYFMFGENLTELEMIYRQKLARRLSQ